MLPERLRRALPIVAVAVLLCSACYCAFYGADPEGPDQSQIRGGDLVSYWAGGTILAQGDAAHLYSARRARKVFAALDPKRQVGYPMGYPPPLYQLLAAPQPALSYFSAAKALLLATAALHLVASGLIVRATTALHPWRREAFVAAALLPAAFSALGTGQLSGLWTIALAGCVVLRANGRPRTAGLVLAPLWMKPTLGGPVFLTFALCGEGAVVGGMIAGGAVILGLSLAGGGRTAWTAWYQHMRDPAQVANAFLGHWKREVTLRTLFSALVSDKALGDTLGRVGMGIGAALVAVIAVSGRRVRASLPLDVPAHQLAMGAVLAAVLLASPHLLDYDFGMYLPALAAAAGWVLSGRARWPRIGAAACVVAWLAGASPDLNGWLHSSVSSLGVALWVGWMAAELGACRNSTAGSVGRGARGERAAWRATPGGARHPHQDKE